MASVSPNPKFRAFDSNGEPLSGGLLYTYDAGTTTPKATFTTEAGDVANANPVVLDSDGYADVWLGDGGYKFTLTDSADVLIYTVDSLGGTSSTAYGANVNAISTNTAITNLYLNSANVCTGSPTLSLLSATSAGEGFYFSVKNNGTGVITIDPDATETIDGFATVAIAPNQSAIIICNGSEWYSFFLYNVTNFSDADFKIQNDVDNTKEIDFDASGITTGTTRTLTAQDKDVTLMGLEDVLDEDDFASDSEVRPPSQQSAAAYIATAIAASVTSSQAADGYVTLEDGTTVQWGYDNSAIATGSTKVTTFPIAFSTACLWAGAVAYDSNSNNLDRPMNTQSFSTTGVTIGNPSVNSGGAGRYWLAIGY